jgi:hypothetical protein
MVFPSINFFWMADQPAIGSRGAAGGRAFRVFTGDICSYLNEMNGAAEEA